MWIRSWLGSMRCVVALVALMLAACTRGPTPPPATPTPFTIVLEAQAGAVGGNAVRVTPVSMRRVDHESPTPLSFAVRPEIRDDVEAYSSGGPIPKGKQFVIEEIRYRGTSDGDSNGHGLFRVSVRNTVIVEVGETAEMTEGVWTGRLEVVSGRDAGIQLRISNSSSGHVEFLGFLEEAPALPAPARSASRWIVTAAGQRSLLGLLTVLVFAHWLRRRPRLAMGMTTIMLAASGVLLYGLWRWGTPAADLVRLYSRQTHADYESATFSFEHGIRDDPALEITRNDWDVEYGNGGDSFNVRMVVDDRSRIEDLGRRPWLAADFASCDVSTTAGQQTAAIAGHLYLAHIQDSDTDLVVLLRVDELVPGDTCSISWRIVDPAAHPAIGSAVFSIGVLTVFLVSLLIVLSGAGRGVRGALRRRRGRCPRCAYQVTGSRVCSECGLPLQKPS